MMQIASHEDMIFPQYRKYANDRNFFKIFSPFEFEEVYFIGKNSLRRFFKAEAYPEKLLIADLLSASEDSIIVITAEEFEAL
jgi:hypothetical protein